MHQADIFGPFVGTMLLTLVVWIYMYVRRIPFIVRSKLTPQQLAPLEFARLSPPDVANASDNLKNLFELPTIFYAVVLYLYATQAVDALYLGAAWTFLYFGPFTPRCIARSMSCRYGSACTRSRP